MNRALSTIFFSCVLPILGAGQEMIVTRDSASVSMEAVPRACFFGDRYEADVIVPGGATQLDGAKVLTQIFQRVGEQFLPLGQVVEAGTVERRGGLSVARLSVEVPEFKAPTQVAIQAQVDGGDAKKTIFIHAVEDDMLPALSEVYSIRHSDAEAVADAFRDRELRVIAEPASAIHDLGAWAGLWFIYFRDGEDRRNFTVPTELMEGQFLILFEKPDGSRFQVHPISYQRGQGWVIHLGATWMKDFSTNAGTQLALTNIIKQLTSK